MKTNKKVSLAFQTKIIGLDGKVVGVNKILKSQAKYIKN